MNINKKGRKCQTIGQLSGVTLFTILQHKFCTMDHKDMMEDPVRMCKGDVWLIISSTSFIQSLTRMHGAEFARLVHARDWMFFFFTHGKHGDQRGCQVYGFHAKFGYFLLGLVAGRK